MKSSNSLKSKEVIISFAERTLLPGHTDKFNISSHFKYCLIKLQLVVRQFNSLQLWINHITTIIVHVVLYIYSKNRIETN